MNFKKIFLILVSIFFSFSIYQKQVNAEEKIEYSNITEITDTSISYFTNNFGFFDTFYNNTTLNFKESYIYNGETYKPKDMPYVIIHVNLPDGFIIFSDSEIYLKAEDGYINTKTNGKYIAFYVDSIASDNATISKVSFGKNEKIPYPIAINNMYIKEEKRYINSVYIKAQKVIIGTTQDIHYYNAPINGNYIGGLIFKRSYPKNKIATSFVEVKKNYASDNRVSSIDYNVFFGSAGGMTDEEKEAYKNDYVIKYSTDQINWSEYSIADYDKNYMPYRFNKNETLYVITVKKDNDEIVDTASLTVDGIGKYYSSITNEYYDTIDEKQKMEEEYENSDLKDISTDDTTSNKADIVTKIKALILDKLPILEQIPRIYNSFHYDNDYEGKCINIIYTPNGVVKDYICRPNVQVDLSYFGVGKIDVINFNYVVQYRDTIIKYQRFFMYFLTFIALVRIVRGYFK